MSQQHYIDNEVPSFAEWDVITDAGASDISQSEDASFPERGSMGLRCTVVNGVSAYAKKNLASAPDSLSTGFWFRFADSPTWSDWQLFQIAAAENDVHCGWLLILSKHPSGPRLQLWSYAGWLGDLYSDGYYLVPERWHYIAIIAAWNESLSYANLYIDGVYRGQAAKVGDATASKPDRLYVGNKWASATAGVMDFDEIKIRNDTTYPEPYVPTPPDEYPSADRTVVLYRGASDDSRQFADYCVSQLGVPRANLIRLDTASADECLTDYATFQSQVETPIDTYFGLHPTVSSNCSCFLIGHGVPGEFTSGGVDHSAASRLMNYGTAFSSGAANPLYNPTTVARLTKTDLGGKYLACRIDADVLAEAYDVIGAASSVSDLSEIPNAHKLYSDDAAYRSSLSCQKLRILTAALGTFSYDAFVFGDTGSPGFGATGVRAAFIDDSAGSADTLRANSSACGAALIDAGYAAALGCSEAADSFDAESFFEMLRLGGTFAEAVMVAVAKLDYTAVPAGSPLMTVAFRVVGYNLYGGIGSVEHMDWENPVACLRSDQGAITISHPFLTGRRHVYGVRAVSRTGLEEHNTHIVTYVEIDGDGDLLSCLARPEDVTTFAQSNQDLLIGFSHRPPLGFAAADGFDVLSDHGTGELDLEEPIATVDQVGSTQHDFELSIPSPETPLLLAVRARSQSRTGPLSETVLVPLRTAPSPPTVL